MTTIEQSEKSLVLDKYVAQVVDVDWKPLIWKYHVIIQRSVKEDAAFLVLNKMSYFYAITQYSKILSCKRWMTGMEFDLD